MPSVENRKVIKVGRSLLVTLPKPWADFNQVQAGDEVQIETNGKVTIRLIPKGACDRK